MKLIISILIFTLLPFTVYAQAVWIDDRLPANATNVDIGITTSINWTLFSDLDEEEFNVSIYGMHEDDVDALSCWGTPHRCSTHGGNPFDQTECEAAGCTWIGPSSCKGTHDPCETYNGNRIQCTGTNANFNQHACDFYADQWVSSAFLRKDEDVVNNTFEEYNWSHSPFIADLDTILLYHLDEIASYGEDSSIAIDWAGNETDANVSGTSYFTLLNGFMGKWISPNTGISKIVIEESVEVKNSGFPMNTTIIGWFIFNPLSTQNVLFERIDLGGSDGFKLVILADDTIGIQDDAGTLLVNTTTTINVINEFNHIAWTCEKINSTACTAKIYINGVFDVVQNITLTQVSIGTDTNLLVGANGVDEFIYSKRVYNATEINDTYRSRLGHNRWWVNITGSTGDDNDQIPIWVINVTLPSAIADPCAYGGSGNYSIDCSTCNTITANVDVGGNEVIMTGDGTVKLESNVTNWAFWFWHNPCIFDWHNPFELRNE